MTPGARSDRERPRDDHGGSVRSLGRFRDQLSFEDSLARTTLRGGHGFIEVQGALYMAVFQSQFFKRFAIP
jgi:hypothetical protein